MTARYAKYSGKRFPYVFLIIPMLFLLVFQKCDFLYIPQNLYYYLNSLQLILTPMDAPTPVLEGEIDLSRLLFGKRKNSQT